MTAEIVLHDRVELDRLYLVWPTVPHFHGDDAALLLLGDVLARGRSSRLHRKLVIEEQIAQDVTAYQSGRELAGSFGIIVTLRPSRSINQALSLVEARARRHRGQWRDRRRAAPRPEHQGRQLLFRTRAHGRIRRRCRSSQRLQRLPRRSVADHHGCATVSRALQPQSLSASQRVISIGKPHVSLSVVGRRKASWRARRSTARLRSPAPSRRAIARRCPKSSPCRPGFRSGSSRAAICRPWPARSSSQAGASLQQPAQAGLAQLTTVMLDEGTSSRSAEEIALAVESMGATIDASCGWDGAYVSFRCLKANLLSDPRLDRRHPLEPDLSGGRVGPRPRPDARGPEGRTRQRRVARVPRHSCRRSTRTIIRTDFLWLDTEASVSSFTPADLASFHCPVLALDRRDDRRRRRC